MKVYEADFYIKKILDKIEEMDIIKSSNNKDMIEKEEIVKYISDMLLLDESDSLVSGGIFSIISDRYFNPFYIHDERVLRDMLSRRPLEEILAIITLIKDLRMSDFMFDTEDHINSKLREK